MKYIILLTLSLILGLIYLEHQANKHIDNLNSILNTSLKNNYIYYLKSKNSKLKIVYKTKEKIIEKIVYVPKEGEISIIQSTNSVHATPIINETLQISSDTYIIVKKIGFTFYPRLSIDDQLNIGINSRLFFINNFGLGIGYMNKTGPMIFGDVHLGKYVDLLDNSYLGIYYSNRWGIIWSLRF